MPKISGVFAQFDNLDQIPVESFIKWFSAVIQPIRFQNFVANRLLYPQTVPVTTEELKLDLTILREALKEKGYVQKELQKISIPVDFLDRFPDIAQLVLAFVDAYLLESRESGIWKIVTKDKNEQILGTFIIPTNARRNSSLQVGIENKIYDLKLGSLARIPCLKNHCRLFFKIKDGTLLGKDVGKADVFGGRLGIIVDGRLR